MKKQTIVKEAVILLLATIMVTSTLSVANTRTDTTTQTSDVQSKEIWLGYTTAPANTKDVVWVHYDDGGLETMVGSSYPPLFMAIRLTSDELGAYDGFKFIETSWYHVVSNASIPDHDYDAKIWTGDSSHPIDLLLNDTGLLASGEGWTNHTLSTPITIDASNDYWIVIKCYAYPATAYYDYPMPFDTNPASNISLKSKWWHNNNNHPETDFYEVATLNGAWLLRVAVEGEVPDTTPPETTCTLSGEMQGSVYITDVTATLTATDVGSGVNYTMYKLDNDPWTMYSVPFYITGNGEHTIQYYSVDNAGNIETTQTTTLTIQYPVQITIKGGLGVSAAIKNNGTVDITNMSWNIQLGGGIIVYGKTKSGTIDLAAGEEKTVRDFVVGFGKPTITVTAGGTEVTGTGMVILVFVLGVA
jgi:hypothetical protein